MNNYRQPTSTQMLLALASSGQTYPQTNTISLLGTHTVNAVELRGMQRGAIHQGIENAVATNLVSCLRLKPGATAYRLRPYLIGSADPSGVSVKLGIGLYPRFHGEILSGASQGINASTGVEDTARTAGTTGEITLVGKSTSIGAFTTNPLTGEDWPAGIVAGSRAVYPVVGATLVGAFGRLVSLEGFATANPDSGYILVDPAFSEYLIAKIITIATPGTVLGVLLAIESDC